MRSATSGSSAPAVVAGVHLPQDPLHARVAHQPGRRAPGPPRAAVRSSWVGPTPPQVKIQPTRRRSSEQRLDDGVDPVGHHVDGGELDAELVEPARQERAVLVLHLGGQHLAAHDHARPPWRRRSRQELLHRAGHLRGDPLHRLLPVEVGDPLPGARRMRGERPAVGAVDAPLELRDLEDLPLGRGGVAAPQGHGRTDPEEDGQVGGGSLAR